MNARMTTVERRRFRRLIVAADRDHDGASAAWWVRWLRAGQRVRLLLRSPMASLRWAIARRRVAATRRGADVSSDQSGSASVAAGSMRDRIG
jgi:hypothetical protein